MTMFSIGQKVRISTCSLNFPQFEGKETIITSGRLPWRDVFYYRTSITDANNVLGVLERCLIPLTDPKADEFIERIKKIAREPSWWPKIIQEK